MARYFNFPTPIEPTSVLKVSTLMTHGRSSAAVSSLTANELAVAFTNQVPASQTNLTNPDETTRKRGGFLRSGTLFSGSTKILPTLRARLCCNINKATADPFNVSEANT